MAGGPHTGFTHPSCTHCPSLPSTPSRPMHRSIPCHSENPEGFHQLQEVAQRERQLLADRLRCAWEKQQALEEQQLSSCVLRASSLQWTWGLWLLEHQASWVEAGLKDEESKVSYSKLLSSESQLKLNLLVLQKDKKQYKHLLFFPAGALFQSQSYQNP